MQFNSSAIEFKASNIAKSGEFEGHGSTFGDIDLGGDVVLPGAFKASLERHKSESSNPALLWSHDPSEPIGIWKSIQEDSVGLKVHGKLTLATERGKGAYALMRDGALSLSIGYQPTDFDYTAAGVRRLKAVELIEISAVATPMNRRAKITNVKNLTGIRGYESLLREELGCSVREARKLASGGWPALTKENGDSAELDELAALMREINHELRNS